MQYLGLNEREGFNRGVLRGGMTSPASLFVAQMQDWLELGEGSRINTPGTGRDNWQWRLLPGELTVKLIGDIREMTRIYGRLPAKQSKNLSDIRTVPGGFQASGDGFLTIWQKNLLYRRFYSFFRCFPAAFSISFFVPPSKATSARASPPIGFTDTTVPLPKAVCSTWSPLTELDQSHRWCGRGTAPRLLVRRVWAAVWCSCRYGRRR